ncbi:DUF402 domain-containing protein [Mycoplasma sp. 744]|uniref:DUF402 domain-containing protein n=1 Tax=unclassified Mycoplasma TaxID=2683645 RepID=UPI00211C5C5C|nr:MULTISPECIES: DUF402 domain-containing protein [unclassified Mycoplasma]MEA4115410.1 DUF402 domain-containing protein [Mycoplasma sp. 744]UUM19413.1 DUF402 domain-containing protein [Mycoplasma sp. 1018B]
MNYKNSPIVGSLITVQAYKYNGTLYRQWNDVKVLKNTPKQIILVLYKNKVNELNKKDWYYKEPVIWFLPKNEMHNALILLKNKNYVYVNIASTPIFEDQTLKFIDLDIDIKKYPDKPLSIVDQEDLAINSIKWKYPKKLMNKILNSVSNVVNKNIKNQHYYNEKIVDYYIDIAKKNYAIKWDFRNNKKTK